MHEPVYFPDERTGPTSPDRLAGMQRSSSERIDYTMDDSRTLKISCRLRRDAHACVAAGCLLWGMTAGATELYVDPALTSDCPRTYEPQSRSCGGGTDVGVQDFSGALERAGAGDTILLRQGTYAPLVFTRSGNPGSSITVRSYAGETATVMDPNEVAIQIRNQTDIVIEALNVQNVLGFARLEEAQRITIADTHFTDANSSGTTGGIKLVRSTDNRLESNSIVRGNDSLVIQDNSDRNLILNNTFQSGRHSLISVRCSNQNIIRGNRLANPLQKAVEIYDCEGVSDAPFRLDATKQNVIEGNWFLETRATDRDHRYNGIQHGAQYTIVRNNLFTNCKGGGVNYQSYSDESLYVYGNRMYGNTFYDNQCHAIIGDSENPSRFYGNIVKNNLLYKNTSCDGAAVQTRITDPTVVILEGNAIVDADPGFVDPASNDFFLENTSPHIDAGAFVTSVAETGSGYELAVEDARYFHDGMGIAGEQGDEIRIEGSDATARVTAVDYGANVLTLDQPLSWTAGDGVHLAYEGAAPEPGAFEAGSAAAKRPMPPENVRVVDAD